MENQPKEGNVPQTPVQPKSKYQCNLGNLVKNLMVAHLMAGIMRQEKKEDLTQYFLGIVTGYNDWIAALHIDEDTLDDIQMKLDKEVIKTEAKRLAEALLTAESKKKKLVTGLEVHGKEARVAKKVFDKRLKGEL